MKSSKDQIYIDKVLSGDASSYRHLVEAYKDMAYTVALKIVRNSEDAEEVAQDSFIKAFQQLKTFQENLNFQHGYTPLYIERQFQRHERKR